MPAALVTKDLRRSYDGREAVRGITLEIPEGEIFGLLGPNGAGKTTTLSMISTRIRPTAGTPGSSASTSSAKCTRRGAS